MARRRKRKPSEPSPEPQAPAVGTHVGQLLEQAGLARATPATAGEPTAARAPRGPGPEPAAPPVRGRTTSDLAAWNEAYRGVAPIRRRTAARPVRVAKNPSADDTAAVERAADAAARSRLSALVAGGVRFAVDWDDAYVLGVREGVDRDTLQRRLSGRGFAPEARLDLHGARYADVAAQVETFVRSQHRRGRRYLLLIVGKGHHSEDGRGVLAREAAEALTGGGAAPVVAGFCSADASHGGTGALAVALR
jgi:DNA-nicking Smr family endonuclease